MEAYGSLWKPKPLFPESTRAPPVTYRQRRVAPAFGIWDLELLWNTFISGLNSSLFSKRTAVPSPINIGPNPLFKAYQGGGVVRFEIAKKPANIGLARFARLVRLKTLPCREKIFVLNMISWLFLDSRLLALAVKQQNPRQSLLIREIRAHLSSEAFCPKRRRIRG